MSIYKRFCREVRDEDGKLRDFTLCYPDNFNFAYDVVEVLASEAPEKRALVWCNAEGDERSFTFRELNDCANRMANVMRAAGIGRGDRVLLVLKRHYEYWPAVLALHKLGAVMIPATHMLTAKDFAYRIKASGARAVLCTTQNEVPRKLRAAIALSGREQPGQRVPEQKQPGQEQPGQKQPEQEQPGRGLLCWCVQGEAEGFVNMTRQAETASEVFARVPTLATDPMALYFTSGTTGEPKGVIHDFTYPLAHIVTARDWQQAQEGGLHFTVAETGWAKASWGKLYGQWLVGSAVMVYDFDNFDPRQLTAVINRYGVTSFCAPPTVYRYLVRKELAPMPTLRCASTAGEMLAPEVFRKFKELTGLSLREGYGQTETTLLLANFAGDEVTPGSLGKPSAFYRVDIRRRDGTSAAAGEVGEIVVLPREGSRSIGIFCGYLNDAAQYEHAWRGGVYHTGDAASRDAQGRYYFHGRFDDIIKTGGFRVGPYEVENVLMEHPAVAECSVIGVPDTLRGQAVKAIIVPGADYRPTSELAHEIKEACNRKLAEYKWIRLIEFVNEMPKTISGKIQKNVLRAAQGGPSPGDGCNSSGNPV